MTSLGPVRELDVLVVGAGPAGLIAAIELARRSINVRIVEKEAEPQRASRAKGLQPRTLEILCDIGVIDEVLAGGSQFPRWQSYQGATLKWEKCVYDLLGITIENPGIERPFTETLLIPQWRFEQILRTKLASLGVRVEYGTPLIRLLESEEGVHALLDSPSGAERVTCRYLIGADGARSFVRKSIGVRFSGETMSEERYVVADVLADGLSDRYWMNWSLPDKPNARISMCPLSHSRYFQFVAPIPIDLPQHELSLGLLQKLFDERCGWPGVNLSGLRWITSHVPSARLADHYRVGRTFLVGDAAHSPPTSPGQGLNLSVQDAYNLGWKLAAMFGGDDPTLLDTYEKERRPIGAGVVGVLAKEMIATGIDLESADLAEKRIRQDIFNTEHNYRGSALAVDQRRTSGRVQAGDRAPGATIRLEGGDDASLFDLIRGTHFTAIWLNSHLLQEGFSILSNRTAEHKAYRAVPSRDPQDVSDIHRVFGVSSDEPTLIVIRPDGYIALCAGDGAAMAWGERLKTMSFWSAVSCHPEP
ncbi:FAD-binding protein [Rhizobium vallis]|uniref:FAD-binding protein n=1 Tax=Rhizobium vallis TaxID=634290 RepID=A0A3S0T8E1_9HYPH|nr:FAD-dependent oxidoreductase [Rhizobium vallis]RUM20446.1 FAD-binding protein [Rhizobium vallis]